MRGVISPQGFDAIRKQAMVRFGLAALMIPAIIFAMAGTIHYWQGWLYWMVLSIPMIAAAIYFLRTDPELLRRRMKFQEKEREQQTIVLLGYVVLVAGFLAIGYDLRQNGLNQVPVYAVLAADIGVLLGYCLILWVFKENRYAARTVEVEEGQKVVTTGPYSIIRHPMYLGVLVMYLLTPIALGSWLAVPIVSLYIPLLVWRIIDEEKVLLRDLPGYHEYRMNRPYRLLPFVW